MCLTIAWTKAYNFVMFKVFQKSQDNDRAELKVVIKENTVYYIYVMWLSA